MLYPIGFSLEAYKSAFQNSDILIGYRNTIFYTIGGCALNMLLTSPCAYALSKKDLWGGSKIMMLFVFTMYFGGGMIPTYLLMKGLHLLNTWWVIPLASGLNVTNLIIARSFFVGGVPHELEESAELDGCSVLQTFLKIILPLSKAMLGVILLYYAVAHWNNYLTALYYLPMSPEKYPLQMVLRQYLTAMQHAIKADAPNAEVLADIVNQIKYSTIVIASLPLLIVYPFIQKFFAKGVMLGSVKG